MDHLDQRSAGNGSPVARPAGGPPPSEVERAVPLPEAERLVLAALRELALEAGLEELQAGGEPTAYRCVLRTASGQVAPEGVGMGKGLRQEARVGALFEALEHYATGPEWFDPARTRLRPARALAGGVLGRDVIAPLLAELGDQPLACHDYIPLHEAGAVGDHQQVAAPVFLGAPWYLEDGGEEARAAAGDRCDYRWVARYSSNSGSAIGVTAAEALVHALNEAVERDAYSLLLAHAFLGGGHRLRRVDVTTLPRDLAAAHALAQRLAGQRVHLLDMTTDLGVPTFLAYAAPTAGVPHRRGAGTSLSGHYAAWRALTEFIQGVLSGDHSGAHPSDLSALARYPELHACGRFDLTAHLASARTVPYVPPIAVPANPAEHLRALVDVLTRAGHPPYHRIVAELPGGITAVHTLVPGLERFMLILQGALILPGPRAQAALTTAALP
ncbi:YcaO-like family protein [Microbispora corallina]|uniref:YcaO domain-containing protein n=1 Tax=Microbispora corallina TaxID=83302 RepID=A0ABQ4G8A1_9ACTN|nr:YcaO-like family protein [Microbispora corallina]GIH43292.1 hypothetical protein Mco01_62920 [Microbispora corallina]